MDNLLLVLTWIIGLMFVVAFGLMAWKTHKTTKEIKGNKQL